MSKTIIHFADVAKIINYSANSNIDYKTPIDKKDGLWALYKASYKFHLFSQEFKILHLYEPTNSEIIQILNKISQLDQEALQIICTESNFDRIESLISEKYEKYKKRLWTPRSFLISFIKEEISSYKNKISDDKQTDFVQPKITIPRGLSMSGTGSLINFFTDPSTDNDMGKVAVLLAEPGQGKTYTSRKLTSQLLREKTLNSKRDKFIPLFIDSSQWKTMTIDDQKSLFKTITHSFKYFGAQIPWIENHEDDFIKIALKADIFKIIFDGFDEYVIKNRENPIEILETLISLAESTETRLMITSRTSYWDNNILEADDNITKNILQYKINPFDEQLAGNYFQGTLNNEIHINTAKKIYKKLSRKSSGLAGRGFVLRLIADIARTMDYINEDTPIDFAWLIDNACEREILRHTLPLTSKQQINIIKYFASEISIGKKPSTQIIKDAISLYCDEIDELLVKAILDSLEIHILIEKPAKDKDEWVFKENQVYIYLLTQEVIEKIGTQAFKNLIDNLTLDDSILQELGNSIIDDISNNNPQEDKTLKIKEIIQQLLNLDSASARKLASVILIEYTIRNHPKGSSHAEKTNFIFTLNDTKNIDKLYFSGTTIEGFDFRKVKFKNCNFEKTYWVNCTFDIETSFENCVITNGISANKCTNFGRVQFINSKIDTESAAYINSVKISENEKKYSSSDLKNDVSCVIDKFIFRNGIKTVEKRNLSKGIIGKSIYKEDIINTLLSLVIEEHRISGKEGGYHVKYDKEDDVKFYAANNVFVGVLKDTYDKLCNKLEIHE
jgi:hypothetical protein